MVALLLTAALPSSSAQLVEGGCLPWPDGQGEARPSQSQGFQKNRARTTRGCKAKQALLSFRVRRSRPADCFKQQHSVNLKELLSAAARGVVLSASSFPAAAGVLLGCSIECRGPVVGAPPVVPPPCWRSAQLPVAFGQPENPGSQALVATAFSASCFSDLWVNPARLGNSQCR